MKLNTLQEILDHVGTEPVKNKLYLVSKGMHGINTYIFVSVHPRFTDEIILNCTSAHNTFITLNHNKLNSFELYSNYDESKVAFVREAKEKLNTIIEIYGTK